MMVRRDWRGGLEDRRWAKRGKGGGGGGGGL